MTDPLEPPRRAPLQLIAAFLALLTGLAAPAVLGAMPPLPVLAASALLGVMLAALCAYDLDQLRLPDWLTLPLGAIGLAVTVALGTADVTQHAAAAMLAGGGLWLVGLGYQALRQREGLGLGDVKLFAALGAWVGPAGLASTLLLACLAALTALLAARACGHRIEATTPVPFGLFLALGGWVTWLYGPLV